MKILVLLNIHILLIFMIVLNKTLKVISGKRYIIDFKRYFKVIFCVLIDLTKTCTYKVLLKHLVKISIHPLLIYNSIDVKIQQKIKIINVHQIKR